MPTASTCVSAITTNVMLPAVLPGNGVVPEPADEIEVDQEVQRLEDHADRDRRCHGEHLPRNGALRQVFHRRRVRSAEIGAQLTRGTVRPAR